MEHLAPLLPYATLLAVAVTIVFGVATVLHGRRLRYLTVAVGLVESVQTDAFTHAMELILDLPESLGVIVFHRLLPLDIVDELVGGYLRASWARLAPYVARRRATLGPTFAEWFEWLALRSQERAPCRKVGSA